MTEKKAFLELQKGSQKALIWFMEKYSTYVSTVIYNVSGGKLSKSDIEETASDVFLVLWNRADTMEYRSIKGFLAKVARNTAIKKLRTTGQDLSLEDDYIVIEHDSPENIYLAKERAQIVRCAVLDMDEPDREIFLRHYYYGQSYAEISDATGIKIPTIKTRAMRGRVKLKNALTAKLYGEEVSFV